MSEHIPEETTDADTAAAASAAAAAEAAEKPTVVEFGDTTYLVPSAMFGDLDLIEDLQKYLDGAPFILPRIVERMLGAEQYAKFKAVSSNESGRVDIDTLRDLFAAIDTALGK